MGIFGNFKKTFGDRVSGRFGRELGDKTVDKVLGNKSSGSSVSAGANYGTRGTAHDAEHEAQIEAMRKENELEALKMERAMQKSAMRFMDAAAGSMEETEKLVSEQNKKNKK